MHTRPIHKNGRRQRRPDESAERRNQRTHPSHRTRTHPLQRLQQTHGNQVVQRLAGQGIQPKFEVGPPNDRYEREAERVARAVTSDSDPTSQHTDHPIVSGERVQRMCPRCQKRHAAGKPLDCPECETELQRTATTATTPSVDAETTTLIQESRRGGHPLPAPTRSYFEPRFGHGFGDVRVHTDSKADEAARAVDARAFTLGSDIVFRSGAYQPEAATGTKLLAHELTHVVQQAGTSARVQRQLVTPLGPGGGFGGVIDRDRRRTEREGRRDEESQKASDARSSSGCNVQLCYLPLDALRQLFIDRGLDPDRASRYSYLMANHVFIRWNDNSAGFTRLHGEPKSAAQVHIPEPRAGEGYETCVNAELRTVPRPTLGQMTSFSPLGAVRDVVSYGRDVVHGLRHCWDTNCEEAITRIESMLRDRRQGLYDLYDDNCETWARNVLRAACLQAPEVAGRGGGVGNIVQRILRETPAGDAYHALRLFLGRTRPMPQPGEEEP